MAKQERRITFRILFLIWLPLSGVSEAGDRLSDRYTVRDVEGVIMLIDLETGWTWKQIGPNPDKPPRWQRVQYFDSPIAAKTWLREHPEKIDQPASEIEQWAQEVLLNREYRTADDTDKVIRRWVTSPTVSIFGPTPERTPMVEHAVKEINSALKSATRVQLKLVEPQADDAAIKVHFMPFGDFAGFCRERDLLFTGRDYGCFYTKWDKKDRITSAHILIATDKSYGKVLQHLILEELTQSLGPMNDSAFKPDSIFYSARSAVTRFSADDRKLLQLLYQHLKPGDSGSRVEKAFSRYWKP